jgi:hypothetical protein
MTGRRNIIDRMTPSRLAWLERLETAPQRRTSGPVAHSCLQLGWTEYVLQRGAERAARSELRRLYPNELSLFQHGWRSTGLEAITELGRQRLQEARQ